LREALAAHRAWAGRTGALTRRRDAQKQAWVDESIRARFGAEGLLHARSIGGADGGPFTRERALARELSQRLARTQL
jgi:LAO/AO transport system kinase